MELFQEAKNWLTAMFGLSRDALHIHVGLVIFFAAHWVLGRKLGSFVPLAVLFALVLLGELLDILFRIGRGHEQVWLENLVDIWNTMFWPLLLTVYGRWGPKNHSTGSN